jgi:hypothetical protein
MKNLSAFPFSILLCCFFFYTQAATAQSVYPFGEVRAWSGTLTVEGHGDSESRLPSYIATGNFTLTDEMMPEGNHWQWPFPQTAGLTDPQAIEDAYRKWNAKVTYRAQVKFKDAVSQANYSCTAEETHPARFQFIAGMGMPYFMMSVELPKLDRVHCAGTVDNEPYEENMELSISDQNLEFQIPVTSSRTIQGSQEISLGEMNFKISYSLQAD